MECQRDHWMVHKSECNDKTPLLFRLPRAWLVGFLSEWLEISEVAILDTAMTMKKHREEFLDCVKEMRSNSVGNYEYALSSDSYLPSFWSYGISKRASKERIAKDTSRLQWISLR